MPPLFSSLYISIIINLLSIKLIIAELLSCYSLRSIY
uniref:Uncharacterized protein n=1 Tax=Podoviridae sp. ctdDI2 TaxID=2826567 RepID=A0A8S5NPP5_9CAUD|nr:MAG TPA: hypothetical protein [Podoviridae sp. ctdDI2]